MLALVLYYYQSELPTKIEIDTSDRVVARVLSQEVKGK
jgi:hypothetical protein